VVLADPDDPDTGWPFDETQRLYRAACDEAARLEHGMWAYVHLQSLSDEAA
jgi:hypothetical protein